MSRVDLALWLAYPVFMALALTLCWDQRPFGLDGPHPEGRLILWAAWAAFLVYSFLCSRKQPILDGLRQIGRVPWGRQVGIDLYLGLTLSVLVIGLHAGSLGTALLWLPAIYLFGNLATLPWFAIHWDALWTVGRAG